MKSWQEIKEVHKHFLIVDMHNDIPMHVLAKRKKKESQVIENNYLKDIKAGGINLIIAAVFIMEDDLDNATENAIEQILAMHEDIKESSTKIQLCFGFDDVMQAIKEEKLAIMLSLEGDEPLNSNLMLLNRFYSLGVRLNGLVWSRQNLIGDGCGYGFVESAAKGGLTELGKCVVKESDKRRIITDLSHLSEAGFWDAIEICQGFLIASHSNTQTVYGIMRNLSDKQILAIAKKGGIIGINGVAIIVSANDDDELIDGIIAHISHIKSLVGVNHIGLGLDLGAYFLTEPNSTPIIFNTDFPRDAIKCYADLPILTKKLFDAGYLEEEIAQIYGGNFLKMLEEIQQ